MAGPLTALFSLSLFLSSIRDLSFIENSLSLYYFSSYTALHSLFSSSCLSLRSPLHAVPLLFFFVVFKPLFLIAFSPVRPQFCAVPFVSKIGRAVGSVVPAPVDISAKVSKCKKKLTCEPPGLPPPVDRIRVSYYGQLTQRKRVKRADE